MSIEDPIPVGSDFEVRADDCTVAVYRHRTNEMLWQIEWEAIEEIVVWKRDLLTSDCICMGFAWDGSDVLKTVDEEMSGWHDLQSAIERKLRLRQTEWWRAVAFPAFAENRRTIWKR